MTTRAKQSARTGANNNSPVKEQKFTQKQIKTNP